MEILIGEWTTSSSFLLNLIRRCDLILLVVDLQGYPIQQLEDAIAILQENRIYPPHLQDQYTGQRRLSVIPVLVVVNKADDESADEDFAVLCELIGGPWHLIPVSATTGRNLDDLKKALFDQLEIIRIYSKPPGQPADLDEPFVVERGCTVEELAAKVHKDFAERLKSARVWGSAEHDGQMVGRDYVLQDGDIIELRI